MLAHDVTYMTIGSTLCTFAASKPDAHAIICDGLQITWTQLSVCVLRLARELCRRTPPGAGIAIHLPNSPHFLAVFLAVAVTGREAQVLDIDWPASHLKDALSGLSPDLLVCEGTDLFCPSLLIDTGEPVECICPGELSVPESPDVFAPFYVGFTSGSTGVPKGYRRNHLSWITSFAADAHEFGIGTDDIVAAPGSMSHSLFLYAAIHALQIGACVILFRRFRPDVVTAEMRDRGASVLYAAPTQLALLLDVPGVPIQTVRTIFSSGSKLSSAISEKIPERFPRADFAEFYGASELSFVSVRKTAEKCPESSVGRAFHGVSIKIRDLAGDELPVGDTGRIFVSSPFLFTDYATGCGELVRHENELCIGDIGYLDRDGFLYLRGRENRMIVTSGKNVFPEQIERVLNSHPYVKASAVFGIPDRRRGERLVALVYVETGSVSASELLRYARRDLSLPFVPRIYAKPPEWRWTASGKTDFARLKADWLSGACEALE